MSLIAVHLEGDLAARIARVLLADRGVHVAMFGDDAPTGGRVHPVERLDRADAVIGDPDDMPAALRDEIAERWIPVISPLPAEPLEEAVVPVISDVANPIHVVLAAADSDLRANRELVHATAAWTVYGRPLRTGVAATFPEPIGPLWAREADPPPAAFPLVGLEAPVHSDFCAASLRVVLGTSEGVEDVTFGVVDHRGFLSAVALAGAALTAVDRAYDAGVQGAADAGGVFLDHVTRAGLVVGRFVRA